MRLATRGSPLALWQARHVASLLAAPVELVVVDTAGDLRQDRPVWQMGGQGVFVKEVQAAVLAGRADAAVHSAKDLPSLAHPGLVLAALPQRADPRDVLVGSTLADLAPGALIATGSVRRRAQLAWLRPDLTFAGLRGNIATRLDRVPPGGAIVMAAAALDRLSLRPPVAEVLATTLMLPQVAQGTIAVECRTDDGGTRAALAAIDDPAVRSATETERGFLARLGSGCDLPVAAHALISGTTVEVTGMLASADGRVRLVSTLSGPVSSGHDLGAALASGLLERGGADLL